MNTRFISLSYTDGRALINVDEIVGIIEVDGKAYISVNKTGTDPIQSLENFDEIIAKLGQSANITIL